MQGRTRRDGAWAAAGIGLALAVGAAAAVSCSAFPSDGLRVDGEKALAHATAIADMGPKPPGSAASRKAGLYLIERMKSLGLQVKTKAFSAETPRGTVEMVNVWGELPGSEPGVIVIASHYDTKLFSDFRFVGANDGAAANGLTLELARVLSAEKPIPQSLWFVFFDGEEAFDYWTETDSLYGSREFVRMLRSEGRLEDIRAMILLDLVGGAGARFEKERHSTDWLNAIVWAKAAELGHREVFAPLAGTAIEDDHLPFLRAGVPAVNIIDLEYAYWHTPEDTPDKLSAEILGVVGDVVLASLPEIARRTAAPR